MKAKVYFSREITPEKVLELYKLAGKELTGNVAIKVHSGEKGNQNEKIPTARPPTGARSAYAPHATPAL